MAMTADYPGTNSTQQAHKSHVTWWPIVLLYLCICLPLSFEVGGTRFTADRLFVLIGFFPVMLKWLSDRDNRKTPVDILIILYSFWVLLTYFIHDGADKLPYSIMLSLEGLTAYFFGRIIVRNFQSYRAVFTVHIAVLCGLFFFTFPELANGRAILQDFFGSVFGSRFADVRHAPRMGFYRVQSVFNHPIIFGLFAAFAVGNAFYLWKNTYFGAGWRVALTFFMTFASLSSGALLSAVLQVGLIIWGVITKNRWTILVAIIVFLYVFVSLASNRGPVLLFIETLTFSSGTAWTRVLVWQYGIASVIDNPLFGFGTGANWPRPPWLTASIDNFWLVLMVRHGFPVMALIGTALALHIRACIKADIQDQSVKNARLGYLVTLVGVIFTLCTVHVWGQIHVFFMFYVGIGGWFYTSAAALRGRDEIDETENKEQSAKPSRYVHQNTEKPSYTRFGD